jgi:hypothetical protein
LHSNGRPNGLIAVVEDGHDSIADGFQNAATVILDLMTQHVITFMHHGQTCEITETFEVFR